MITIIFVIKGCQAKFEKFVKDEIVSFGGFGIGIAMLEVSSEAIESSLVVIRRVKKARNK